MSGYNLTDRQKELLRKLVEYVRQDRMAEPFSLVLGGILLKDGEIFETERNFLGDLSALVEADLLGLRYGLKGNKLYSIKQAGYDAVENDFVTPTWVETPLRIGSVGAIVLQMNAGSIQAVGEANYAKLTQIVNDPASLKAQLEVLTSQLIDEVRSALSESDLVKYDQSAQQFKERLSAEELDPPLIKRLATRLAFLADIEGTLSLSARVWPYLYPLLLIAAERLGR